MQEEVQILKSTKEDKDETELIKSQITDIDHIENLRLKETKTDIDGEKEEMHRAIVNINRKTRPLIKHVSVVKNDILHIDVIEKKSSSSNLLNEVSNWEDLLCDDDDMIDDVLNKVMLYINFIIAS